MRNFRFIIVLFVISSILQFLINDFIIGNLIGTILVQFFASLILAYVYTQFHLKYSKVSFVKVWGIFYAIIICLSLIIDIIGLVP
jgi:hypothetical protein